MTARTARGAARLSSSFWLDVTKDDGSPLLAGLDEVTISYDSRPSATGNTGWSVVAQRSTVTNAFNWVEEGQPPGCSAPV